MEKCFPSIHSTETPLIQWEIFEKKIFFLK